MFESKKMFGWYFATWIWICGSSYFSLLHCSVVITLSRVIKYSDIMESVLFSNVFLGWRNSALGQELWNESIQWWCRRNPSNISQSFNKSAKIKIDCQLFSQPAGGSCGFFRTSRRVSRVCEFSSFCLWSRCSWDWYQPTWELGSIKDDRFCTCFSSEWNKRRKFSLWGSKSAQNVQRIFEWIKILIMW